MGKRTIKKIKKYLYYEDFDLIITSSATRTKQTARIIFSGKDIKEVEAKKLYLPVSEKDQLVVINDLKSNTKPLPQRML